MTDAGAEPPDARANGGQEIDGT
jgi:hypothetical protein